jgi:ABC-type branched-subunit amino acid transport system substrate-binding protein
MPRRAQGRVVEITRRTVQMEDGVRLKISNKRREKMKTLGKICVIGIVTAIMLLGAGFPLTQDTLQAAPPKPEVVRWAVLTDMTGPYAGILPQNNLYYEYAAEWVNAHGGIDGVPLEVVVYDTGGKLDRALAQYEKAKTLKPRPLVTMCWISGISEGLHDLYIEDKMCAFTVSSDDAIYPRGNTFGVYPLYPDQIGAWADYMAKEWIPKNWKKGRPLKVGIITWDTTYGRAILHQEFYDHIRARGMELIEPPELFDIRAVDVTTQVTRVKEKGADMIINNSAVMGPAAVLKGIQKLGWYCPVVGSQGFDWSAARQVEPKLLEGSMTALAHPSWDQKDHPGIKFLEGLIEKKGLRPESRTFCNISAFSETALLQYLMTKIVKEKGWNNLNSMSIKDELFKVKDWWDPWKLMPWTLSADRMSRIHTTVYKFEGHKILPLTDWVECPDLRKAKYRK